MKFRVEREALGEAVAWVARALPARPVVPVLSGLLVEAGGAGLTLSCFDYEVSARVVDRGRGGRAGYGAGAGPPAGRDHPQPAAARPSRSARPPTW